MKIIIINVNSSTKSTGKIAYGQYKKLLEDGHDVRLFYGRDDIKEKDDHIVRITGRAGVILHGFLARLTGLHGYFSILQTQKLIHEIREFKPDLAQLYNLHGYYLNINMLLNFLKKERIPTIYSMLDEFPYLGRCCYSFDCQQFMDGCHHCRISKKEYPSTWLFRNAKKYVRDKQKVYSDFQKICFVAPKWVLQRADASFLLRGKKMYEVDEYVDSNYTFFPRERYEFLSTELIDTEKIIVLTVAPYADLRKGGKYFLDVAKRLRGHKNFQFIYVGMNVEGVEVPDNCKTVGFVSNQDELAEYYSAADVFVCTSLADTMPNVCLDALSCGTPVIGFDNTGIPYTAEKPLGLFVDNENTEELCQAVASVKKKTPVMRQKCREYALKRYSPEIYYKKMLKIYNEMIGKI